MNHLQKALAIGWAKRNKVYTEHYTEEQLKDWYFLHNKVAMKEGRVICKLN